MTHLALQIGTAVVPLADFDGHHDFGDGWWVVIAIGMVAFWALVIAAGIWLVRELTGGRRPGAGRDRGPAPLEILDRRLAEGAISTEEYEERRRVLSEAREADGG